MKACECGCGTEIPEVDKKGRPRSHVVGHSNKGKSNWWLKKDATSNRRTLHEWARKAVGIRASKCELELLGNCKGKIDVHHKDKNATNNDLENLLAVCRSHHRLVENGRIDISDPKMPSYYVDAGGKRRYERREK